MQSRGVGLEGLGILKDGGGGGVGMDVGEGFLDEGVHH